MLEALTAGLSLIASWTNALALLCGMLGGVIIGALPGLTGAGPSIYLLYPSDSLLDVASRYL